MITTDHTKEEKRQTGVYCILNLVNSKMYVGSTGRSFVSRWYLHNNELKRGCHKNRILVQAINKYGVNSFKFIILEVCSPKMNIECEQYYIDTLNPEYNISPTAKNAFGTKQTKEAKEKRNESRVTHIYIVQTPKNEIVETDNLNQFCKRNDISQSCLYHTLTGVDWKGVEYRQHKGYSVLHKRKRGEPAPENICLRNIAVFRSSEWQREHRQKQLLFEYKIELPDKTIVTCNSLTRFCKENNLRTTSLSNTLIGRNHNGTLCFTHKGHKIVSKTPLNHQTESL